VKTRTARRTGVAALATLTLIGIAACSPPAKTADSSSGGVKASAATSAKDLGGMSGLVAAAKKEGTLNVIALPPDWANYGEVIKGFEAKYGLKVDSAQPDASSADEITAAKNLKGQSKAPDVFDLGGAVASANTDTFAPYKVATFGDVPVALKDANGLWVNDYGGYMSIGYDAGKVPAPTKVEDLLKPAYKGKVALNGDPTKAGAAFSGVVMAAISQGGTADDISKGVAFFTSLNAAGNFLPVDPTGATIESGQTPVVSRLGLFERRTGCQARRQDGMEDLCPSRGCGRRLLRSGHQQGRPSPRRGAPVAGVPLLRRGPEPVAQGWRTTGARRGHGRSGHDRQGRL